MARKAACVCGCGRRSGIRHHVVYEQHVRNEGGDIRDARNLVPIAKVCHDAHHHPGVDGTRVLPLRRLPNSVFEFARELFGAGKAYEYLRRRYRGEDPRLAALLDGWTIERAG